MLNQARASSSTSTQGVRAAFARGDDGTTSEASLLSCEFIIYLVRTAPALVAGGVKLGIVPDQFDVRATSIRNSRSMAANGRTSQAGIREPESLLAARRRIHLARRHGKGRGFVVLPT
jgi:hypothetical protein